jgi:peptide alpha-N-acetyltransferase
MGNGRALLRRFRRGTSSWFRHFLFISLRMGCGRAAVQIQMRDLTGFVETRAAMLSMKPGNKSHWITFAVAHHLNGNHDLAAHALETYEVMQVSRAPDDHPTPPGQHPMCIALKNACLQ